MSFQDYRHLSFRAKRRNLFVFSNQILTPAVQAQDDKQHGFSTPTLVVMPRSMGTKAIDEGI